MYLNVGDHYGLEIVLRRVDEEFHEDCVDEKRADQVRIMFWGAIAYNVPCKDCPYVVWEGEKAHEKKAAEENLGICNEHALVEMNRRRQEYHDQEMARRATLPKGQRPRGPVKYPEELHKSNVEKKRSKNSKGGIDWYRCVCFTLSSLSSGLLRVKLFAAKTQDLVFSYRTEIYIPKLYLMYDSMIE